jgi:hypothetical protein
VRKIVAMLIAVYSFPIHAVNLIEPQEFHPKNPVVFEQEIQKYSATVLSRAREKSNAGGLDINELNLVEFFRDNAFFKSFAKKDCQAFYSAFALYYDMKGRYKMSEIIPKALKPFYLALDEYCK